MEQNNVISHAEANTSSCATADNRIFFKVDSIETKLSVYGNDTEWIGSLWQNGYMIASYFSVSTCELGWEPWDEAGYYAEANDEIEEYETDSEAYCDQHEADIEEWATQTCLDCYYDGLIEDGYADDTGIALEDFCQFHQIGVVGSFNRKIVPAFKSIDEFKEYFDTTYSHYVHWDVIMNVSCEDAYVGDIWGDGEWGIDDNAFDECPQYIPCRINCMVNGKQSLNITLDLSKYFVNNLDAGNSYAQTIESYEFEDKVKDVLWGKSVEEAKAFLRNNHIIVEEDS